MEYIQTLNPIIQAFLATLLTWLITALGSSIVFLFKKVNKKLARRNVSSISRNHVGSVILVFTLTRDYTSRKFRAFSTAHYHSGNSKWRSIAHHRKQSMRYHRKKAR